MIRINQYLTAMALAVAAVAPAAATPPPATPVTWTFNNLFLNNGASVVGSFTYDAGTNSFTNINITTSGGTGQMIHTGIFTQIGALGTYSDAFQALFMPTAYTGGSLEGWEYFYIYHPSAARTGAGGTIDFSSGGEVGWAYCGDPACDTTDLNLPATGVLEPIGTLNGVPAGAVPEPASWAMLIAGFGLIGAAARRRRAALA